MISRVRVEGSKNTVRKSSLKAGSILSCELILLLTNSRRRWWPEKLGVLTELFEAPSVHDELKILSSRERNRSADRGVSRHAIGFLFAARAAPPMSLLSGCGMIYFAPILHWTRVCYRSVTVRKFVFFSITSPSLVRIKSMTTDGRKKLMGDDVVNRHASPNLT